MAQAGLPSFLSPAPVLNALQPLRRFLQRATQPCRHTPHGTVYLGDGQPVMVFPAYGEGPESTAEIRVELDDAGFRTYDWGLGADTGPGDLGLDHALRRLEEQVIDVFEEVQSPLTLLGWSLSGIYAREVAKRVSPLVRQVITLGTPFNPAADPRRRCAMLQALEGGQRRMAPAVRQRLRQRPPVPCTSIYATADEATPWRMCVETESAFSENVAVDAASHLELMRHPKVLEAITYRLVQPGENWRAFEH